MVRRDASTPSWSRPGACDHVSASSSSICDRLLMQHLLAGLAIAAPFAFGALATPGAPQGHQVLAFEDPAIVEASDLVVRDGVFFTTNDARQPGSVFAVDGSGHTVGVTSWSGHATDIEALAPGEPGSVWVG